MPELIHPTSTAIKGPILITPLRSGISMNCSPGNCRPCWSRRRVSSQEGWRTESRRV